MKEEKLPKPEGICRFCGKPIYVKLKEHELICRFEKEEKI